MLILLLYLLVKQNIPENRMKLNYFNILYSFFQNFSAPPSILAKEFCKRLRNQALKILPWVCANCGRDFSGKNLRELTVHHKDHNYKNNPPDGSNWELLCLYCHDHEHSRDLDAEWLPTHNSDKDKSTVASHAPFANLDKLLSDKNSNERK